MSEFFADDEVPAVSLGTSPNTVTSASPTWFRLGASGNGVVTPRDDSVAPPALAPTVLHAPTEG